jgi:hypothetical protein
VPQAVALAPRSIASRMRGSTTTVHHRDPKRHPGDRRQ